MLVIAHSLLHVKYDIMIWSKYNYLFKTSNNYFIYNSLSNSFAELDKATYSFISENKENIETLSADKELWNKLVELKSVVDSDEYEFKKIKFYSFAERHMNQQLTLTINPTLDCNFSCPYCFESNHKRIYMNEDVENNIIQFINTYNTAKRIHVTWFGGEPLLHFKRIESLSRKMIALEKDYQAGIITNGFLLSENIVNKFQELKIGTIQITIDGLAYTHDSRRHLKNGGKTFERIMSNIGMVNKVSPTTKICIRVNLDKSNIHEFVELYKFVIEQKFSNTFVSPAFVEDIQETSTNPCLLNQKDKIIFVKQILNKNHLDFSLLYPSSLRHECAVRNPMSVVIGPEGEMYKCWNDVGNPLKIYGYVDKGITNEKILLDYLMGGDPFEDSNCVKCKLLPVCNGGCPYYRILREQKGLRQESCIMMKKNIKSFLTMHYKNKKQSL